jgi:hypothetical protein
MFEEIQHEKILLYKVSVQKGPENLPRWDQLFIIGSAVGGLRRLGEAYISLIYGRKSATAICRLSRNRRRGVVQ